MNDDETAQHATRVAFRSVRRASETFNASIFIAEIVLAASSWGGWSPATDDDAMVG